MYVQAGGLFIFVFLHTKNGRPGLKLRERGWEIATRPADFLSKLTARLFPLRQHHTPKIARIASAVLGRQGQT